MDDRPRELAITRLGLLRRALGALVAAAGLPPRAFARRPSVPPVLHDLSVRAGRGFAGDHELLATVKPHAGLCEPVFVEFRLAQRATVELQALETSLKTDTEVWRRIRSFAPGRHRIGWRPDADAPARTYLLRITARNAAGAATVYGGRPPRSRLFQAPVVRVLGVEADFAKRSYSPGELATLRIAATASSLTIELFQVGPEPASTNRSDEMSGIAVGDAVHVDWTKKGDRPRRVRLALGHWPSGVYFARLTTDDGRLGFAPFVLRPARPGQSAALAVMPTNTWQAYNFRDADGDGWGDTWYAGGSPPVHLDRPYLDRGVPPRFKHHDRAFLQWVARTRNPVDFFADDDLEQVESGDVLRLLYDLVVFPGHSEYMTRHAYDVVTRYRDLGGNLLFLSANNFFRRVQKRGTVMQRDQLWRDLGRPEAALIGVQYRANDDGSTQRPFVVRDAATTAWLWKGTGLLEGSTFGEFVGGFGTEIDATSPLSPPGTAVVAEIPDLFGPGLSAQMTYYETPAGARVFAAGALDFGGSVMVWPMRKMLENLWTRLAPGDAP